MCLHLIYVGQLGQFNNNNIYFEPSHPYQVCPAVRPEKVLCKSIISDEAMTET